jgi:hypothetical protein
MRQEKQRTILPSRRARGAASNRHPRRAVSRVLIATAIFAMVAACLAACLPNRTHIAFGGWKRLVVGVLILVYEEAW